MMLCFRLGVPILLINQKISDASKRRLTPPRDCSRRRVLILCYNLSRIIVSIAMEDNKITYFARDDARNKRVKFGIKAKDRTRHVYVLGKTGMGQIMFAREYGRAGHPEWGRHLFHRSAR